MDGNRGATPELDQVTLPSGAVRFRAAGCLRGLKWVYRCPPGIDWELVGAALERAYADRLVRGIERWGSTIVRRYILQFRAEFRLGERREELALLHRLTASPEQRAASHRVIERILDEVLARNSESATRTGAL